MLPTHRPRTRLLGLLLAVLLAVLGLTAVGPAAQAAPVATPVVPGTAFDVNLPQGQEAWFSFTAQAGQRPGLSFVGSPDGQLYTELIAPDGTVLQADTLQPFKEFQALPSSGTYALHLTATTTTAAYRLNLSLATDTAAALTLGTAFQAGFTVPGQRTLLSFAGSNGQLINIDVAQVALTTPERPEFPPGVGLSVVDPAGNESWIGNVTGATHLSRRLDASGTWKLLLDPDYDGTGTVKLTVAAASVQVVPVTLGKPVSATIAADGGDIRMPFSATAGTRLTAAVTSVGLTTNGEPGAVPGSVQAKVYRPDGTLEFDFDASVAPTFVDDPSTLAKTGRYTLVLTPADGVHGTVGLRLGAVTDRTGRLLLGAETALTIANPGQNALYTFRAQADQNLVVRLAGQKWKTGPASTGLVGGASVTLVGPDGLDMTTLLQPGDVDGEYDAPLPRTGDYKIRVDPSLDVTGSARLTVRYPTIRTVPLTLGTSTTGQVAVGNRTRYRFTATAGRRVVVQVGAPTYTRPGTTTVSLVRPDGSFYALGQVGTTSQFLESEALPTGGTWAVQLDASAGSAVTVPIKVTQPVDQTSNLAFEAPVTAAISKPGQQARYVVDGVKGGRLTVTSTAAAWKQSDGSESSAKFTLLRPDGSTFGTFTLRPVTNGVPRPAWAEVDTGSWGNALDVTGRWTVVVDPVGDAVGSERFVVHQVSDVTGTLELGGTRTVSLSTAGQQAVYTVQWDGEGNLGYMASGGTLQDAEVSIIEPGGQRWSLSTFNGKGWGTFPSTGSGGGTYTVIVDPLDAETGTFTFTVDKASGTWPTAP